MKFVSLDTETSGLDPEWCQILEIGAVVGDFERDPQVAAIPPFHCFVVHEQIVGQPYALAMNAEILRIIANRRDYPRMRFLKPDEVAWAFKGWLHGTGLPGISNKVTFAGKNFGSFDRQFLKKIPNWDIFIGAHEHHRSLDLGSIYLDPEDKVVPGLQDCMKRAGMEGVVTHRATEDAQVVVDLLRARFAPKSGE